MLKKTVKLMLAALFISSIFSTAKAQKLDLNQPLPIDPDVTIGKLDNGLTYYIRPNSKPADKVELRLVVNAGSILEDDNQQGLAHFIEHMNFNGLEHFPKHELVNYLQKIGVKFGADLNANTGWDRTLYILPIPTDNPDNLANGFQIIADWAQGALLTTEEINAERDVISEELRMRDKNASSRMMEQFLPAIFNDSRYSYRLPGGKDSIIQNCSPDVLRKYYSDWYRPNLQAVVVVGDITVDKAKEMIKKYFGQFKNPANERERKYYAIQPYTHPDGMIVTDPEATGYGFSLFFPAQKQMRVKTIGDYKEMLVRRIFNRTLNRVLGDMTEKGNPPFTGAHASISGSFGGLSMLNEGFELDFTPVKSYKTAIDSAVAAILRVRQYGFLENDIENTKKEILSFYEKSYNERDKSKSAAYVREYVGNFMRGETIPGIENEYKYAKAMLPTISTEDVSLLAKEILSNSENFFALITAPEKGDIALPSKEELVKMVQSAFQQKVSAPKKDNNKATSLLVTAPTAGSIVSTKSDKDLGTTTYTLSNGILVTIKSTDFKDDEIIFKGVKYGGSGQFNAEEITDANYATKIVSSMGYGQFTPSQLSDFLSGRTLSLQASMGQSSNAVNGSSSVVDFETLLKLNYLKLTAPRMDKELFNSAVTKMKTRFKFMRANPQVAYLDTLMKVLYNNNPLAPIRFPTEEMLDGINAQNCIDIYKEQFSDAAGFHFFIVGNVKDKDLKPLIEKYIASLPTSDKKPMYKDNGLRPVAGEKVFKFYNGSNPKSLILSMYHGDNIKYSEALALKVDLLGQIMTMEIIDTIREKMAVIYSGGVQASLMQYPFAHYTIMSYLPCGPENVDKILAELAIEVKDFKTTGGPKSYLPKAKKATIETHKDNLNKNGYWVGKLEDIMVWGSSKDFFLNFDKKLNAIDNADIIKTAKLLLGKNHFTAASFPEKNSAK